MIPPSGDPYEAVEAAWKDPRLWAGTGDGPDLLALVPKDAAKRNGG